MDAQLKTAASGRGLVGYPPRASLVSRFAVANLGALAFAATACLLAVPWVDQLAAAISLPAALLVVAFIAIVPGYLNAFLLISLLCYRQHPPDLEYRFPPVSILIAAHNEEENLPETIRGIERQDYPAEMELIIVDDGSQDGTLNYLRSLKRPGLNVISIPHQGKAAALNTAL